MANWFLADQAVGLLTFSPDSPKLSQHKGEREVDTKRSLKDRWGDLQPVKALRNAVRIVRESTTPEAIREAGLMPEEVRKITGRIPEDRED